MKFPTLAAFSIFLASCAPAMPPASPSTLADKPTPAFTRPTLDGQRVGTEGAHPVIVVKFFAAWCEPCKRTLPALERLHKDRSDVLVIGVSEDEHTSEARQMVATYGLTFPVVHDADNMLAGRFRVRDLPAAFVIDKTGLVRWVGVGEDAKLDEAVAAVR